MCFSKKDSFRDFAWQLGASLTCPHRGGVERCYPVTPAIERLCTYFLKMTDSCLKKPKLTVVAEFRLVSRKYRSKSRSKSRSKQKKPVGWR